MSSARVLFVTLMAGCGGSTVFIGDGTDASTSDSGADAASGGDASVNDGAAVDTGARRDGGATPDADPCPVDADVTKLSLPDAGLGDGGSVGRCNACVQTECAAELENCQDDCDCRTAVVAFFKCLGQNKPFTSCGGSLVSVGAAGQSLGLCALNAGCNTSCGQ